MNAPRWVVALGRAVHPGDRAILGLLALAEGVALVRWPVVGTELTPLVLVQSALLVGFLGASAVLTRREGCRWVPYARAVVAVAVVFTLYTSLGKLGVAAMPYLADAWLSHADSALLGFDPSLALQPYQTPGRVEFFSFIYASFIPYIYLSLFLGCLGRRPLEREQFLTGWIFAYVISYLGYIFVPAHGPVVYQAGQYSAPLAGGFFHDTVVRANEATGGLQGVFPSLHVGCSAYLCLFDLRTNRLRGLTYLPIVLLIYGATLFLRYHYVVDLIAGTAIAWGCNGLGRHAVLAWARARQRVGRPALPGGEGDDLSFLPRRGEAGAAPLLPSH
ncbi:hypothetical protein OJF2_69560 [Aquisphaera giovannonii]|uniref:Inositolphosphotransferase Aur1/Ipt1 domain-containing protein n=1 Tax=Aquisphaera giovannonii TaxID=406548 RepID=A0A5B9WE67_9BACT|nr:phosphatase PAP2 family protein [Aquisphaera giovannonii]QEH38355.1 hypothetical protein OJF2_69560 [Aquisphaera giovannonii]